MLWPATIKQHHAFYVLMAGASAISFAKSGVLATILAPLDFAHYSAAFAIVGLVASGISFGLTEGTAKKFTRLIAFGRIPELKMSLDATAQSLLWRHLLFLIAVPVAVWLILDRSMALLSFSVLVLALATNLFSTAASLLRGSDRLLDLGLSVLLRAVCSLAAVSVFSASFGWTIGFAAEALSTALIGAVLVLYGRAVVTKARQAKNADVRHSAYVADTSDGFWLFVAYGVALIPVSLDRAWVTYFAPAKDAAQYAFCGVWIVAASTVAGIYIQKFGPEVVKRRATDIAASRSLIVTTSWHASILAAVLVVGGIACFAIIYSSMPHTLWYKYDLSVQLLLPTLAATAFQVSVLFDWALIALDGERYVFVAASIFAMVAIVAFCACAYLGLGFVGYMTSLAMAKFLQILTMVLCVARLESPRA